MRNFVLTATFAGLIAGAGVFAGPSYAQDMMGGEDEPKAEEQDEKAAQKAAKKAQRQAEKAAKRRRRGLDVDRYVKQVTENLGLNEEQAAQLRTVLTDSVEASEQIRSEAEAKNKELEASRDKQIRELLTDEQAAKFDEMTSARDSRRRQRGERMRGGDRGGQMGGGRGLLGFDPRAVIGELALDENQQAQAKEIMQGAMSGVREKIGAARQQGPEAMKAAMQQIRADVQEQFSAILNEDQRAKFAELTADGGKTGKRGKNRDQAKRQRRDRTPPTPAERMARRLGNVMEAMSLSEDEAMILEPQITRILQLDADTGETAAKEREALEALVKAEGEVDGAGIRARMAALRTVREQQEKTRAELESELRELVTIKQEGMLFLHRVLR